MSIGKCLKRTNEAFKHANDAQVLLEKLEVMLEREETFRFPKGVRGLLTKLDSAIDGACDATSDIEDELYNLAGALAKIERELINARSPR